MRLTKQIRNDIAYAMRDLAFNKRNKEMEKRRIDLLTEVYNSQYSKEEWQLLNSLPPLFVARLTYIGIRDKVYDSVHSYSVNVPTTQNSINTFDQSNMKPEMYKKYIEFCKASDKFKNEKEIFDNDLKLALDSYTTVAKLKEHWANAADIIDKAIGVVPSNKYPLVPAAAIARLDAAIPLPQPNA